MIGNNPVNQRSGLFMDSSMVANIGAPESGQDRAFANDSSGTATEECLFVSLDCICPGNAVVPLTD